MQGGRVVVLPVRAHTSTVTAGGDPIGVPRCLGHVGAGSVSGHPRITSGGT